MLPRISSALANLIKPIARTGRQDSVGTRQQGSFQRFQITETEGKSQSEYSDKKDQQRRSPRPELKLVQPSSSTPGSEVPAVPTPPRATTSVSETFLHLVSFIKQGKDKLRVWMAHQAYQLSLKRQQKGARARPGTILDHKAE